MSKHCLTLVVNRQECRVRVDPTTPLLHVLRHDLGLKGAKHACGAEQCGACQVILDGQAAPSCQLPVQDAVGQSVRTVEGLATDGRLSALQQAFVAENAIQCGYCVAGMLMAGTALLESNPAPTEDEIRAALHQNLCRCGVYPRVIRAIQRAAGLVPSDALYAEIDPAAWPLPPDPPSVQPALPAALQQYPDLDAWIHFRDAGVVTAYTGKAELGQGIVTALAQVVAEELDVDVDQIRIQTADTALTPDEGATAGSLSLETSGGALRQVAAEARFHLLSLAAEEWDAPWRELSVRAGVVRHAASGRQATYWDLLQGQPLGLRASGAVAPKAPERYTVVGQPLTRLDMADKVRGRPRFLHDMDLPGLRHGRVVRGPYAASRLTDKRLDVLDALPCAVQVVEDGAFLAVLCEREDDAIRAMELLAAACAWETPDALPPMDDLFPALERAPAQEFLVVDGLPGHAPIPPPPPARAARAVQARYERPFHMHAALGPSCAIAQQTGERLTVWSHSQGVFQLRDALAQILAWPKDKLRVIHAEGPGCYGHNGADDVALDACLLALRAAGRPVRVQWSRRDEFVYEPYGSAMTMQVTAALDARRAIGRWRQEISSYTHMGRPRATTDGSATLLAAWSLAQPFPQPRPQPSLARHVGLHRNGTPQYRIPETVTVKRFLPENMLRVSAMRSLGAFANLFAIESAMDELARQAGEDPVDFRLRHLADARGRAVIQLLAAQMDWRRRPQPAGSGRGWGMAYGRYKDQQAYAAIGVIVRVARDTGRVDLERAFIAADAGQIVNPDGLSAQLEGSFLQAASWALYEQVAFNAQGVTSTDWDAYPALRATQVPSVQTFLMRRTGQPVMGAGEAGQCPTPAAIANAIYDATGVRLYAMPFARRLPRALPTATASRAG